MRSTRNPTENRATSEPIGHAPNQTRQCYIVDLVEKFRQRFLSASKTRLFKAFAVLTLAMILILCVIAYSQGFVPVKDVLTLISINGIKGGSE